MTITLENIKEFLSTNEGVVKELITLDEVKKAFQPSLDSHVSKSIDTWKKNNLEKLVNDEVSKRNPQETPEQKAIRELQSRLDQADKEKKHLELKHLTTNLLTEKGIDHTFSNYLIGQDEETTKLNVEEFYNKLNNYTQQSIDKRLKGNPMPKGDKPKGTGVTLNDYLEMSTKQQLEFEKTNPTQVENFIKEIQG